MKMIIPILVLLTSCEKLNTGNKSFSSNSISISTRPNIILILVDDVGINALNSTPNINQLAADGMNFTQCRSSATCSPSRFMLMTGKYNFRNYTHWGIMNPNEKTFGNMLHDAGYSTAWYGKDQSDGGGVSANNWGFDNYTLFSVFESGDGLTGEKAHWYRNPRLYTNGTFTDYTNGEYGEDLLTDSVIAFAENAAQPFFAYYCMGLCHAPFQPTPDDSNYNTWTHLASDISYYPNMIKYMDKKVGLIRRVVDSLGQNTIIIFCGDNGAPEGDKGLTTEAGTRVPLMVYWQGNIFSSVNNSLIDFTDFLPTLADVANIPLPDYGVLDGNSFYQQLFGNTSAKRAFIFNHYQKNPELNSKVKRYIQNETYKKYDSTFNNRFYNLITDPLETHPITNKYRSPAERRLSNSWDSILNTMHN